MKTILKTALLLLAVLLVVAGLVATLRVGPAPVVEIRSDAKAIGSKTSLVVVASAPGRGLAGLRVEVEQGGVARVVAQKPTGRSPPGGCRARARKGKSCGSTWGARPSRS